MTDVISIKIDISHARKGLGKMPDAVARAVEPRLWRGAEEVARTAKINAPKAFSNLTNSIRADRIEPLHFQVSQGVNYGRAVEDGSAPHGVNSEKLVPWVERVLGASGKEARDKAFLIARAIRRRGTPAQPHMQPAADSGRDRVLELVLQGVDQGIKESFA